MDRDNITDINSVKFPKTAFNVIVFSKYEDKLLGNDHNCLRCFKRYELGIIHKVRTLKCGDFQTSHPPLHAFKQQKDVIKTIDVWMVPLWKIETNEDETNKYAIYHHSTINQFHPSIAFHIKTSQLFCFPKQMTGFYMKCNTGLKWANWFQN